MKVLVVDDHPLIREALRYVLRALDARTELLEAQNASEALEAARAHADIDLILLDLGLPGSDGFEVLRTLRSEHAGTPVVVVSAADDHASVMRALDDGAMGFIPKAAKNDVLLGALRLVLAGGVYLPPQMLREPTAAYAVAVPAGKDVSYRDIGLTARQADVLALLVQGKPNKLICRALNLAEGTVKIHITAILRALKVANRTQAVIAVSRLGLRFDKSDKAGASSAPH
jgi:DNA-binding NarL/FixJ family response regulator